MFNLGSILMLLSVLVTSSYCREKARFDYYRLYEVTAKNEQELAIYQQILDYPDGYKFITNFPSFIGSPSQLMVPPHKFGEWSELVDKFKLNIKLVTNNLQEDIDKEESKYNRRKAVYDWSSFRRYNETYAWMNELAASRPNDVSTFIVGTSFEGREIKGLRINIGNGSGKKSIFFESNIHANEWIGCSTTTFIINQLLSSNDEDVKQLLEKFDWWFVPILNIDGYEYTWNVDRTWRKTRGPTRNLLCQGADPNRNWNIQWGLYGGSSNPCSTGYYGDFAFSEVEMKQLSEFITTVPNLFGYISFHSYGRYLMTPFAYTAEAIENLDVLNEIGQKALDSISQFRATTYRLGKIYDFFRLVAGSSVDYITVENKPKIVYCYELSTNHILPNEEIQATGEEIFASIKTIFKDTIDRGLV